MKITAIFLVLTAGAPAFASNTGYIQRLSHARSAFEVQKIKSDFEELQITRKACRLQLQAKQAPLTCYASLRAEIQWGLHPQLSDQARLRDRLDDLCSEAAEKLRVPRRLPEAVSAKCRSAVQNALKILAYRENRPIWSEN